MLIESKNWSEYQSFRKDRASTSWIKLHTKLLNNFQFNKLSPTNKWCLVGIWMILDRKTGKIEIEEDEILYKIGVKSLDLNALEHFIVVTDNNLTTSGQPVVTSGKPSVNPEKRREEKRRGEENREEHFLTFWDTYPKSCPRKNNKKGVRLKFLNIFNENAQEYLHDNICVDTLMIKNEDCVLFGEIMDGLNRAISCRQWLEESGKFIPSPMVFLNQERWSDGYDTADNSVTEKMEGLGL